ncbi:MAG: undecaprenyldiphospho-muramoylpentapeptide beta-N-acetylglucosaminyltransferase [Bacteroidota bacterium]|jgi:UDP-N-acetylglucosamine--N-acetylmuramyl-(pentapeptide) pyrophosphoryl-undecaprenol N-acetylglucosamine transferase
MKLERVIISGGGTGGHIFPAIAIADEIKRKNPAVSILFVGAIGKMEMDKVPAAGYNIVGLPIVGFQRKLTLSNFLLPFKLINSLLKAFLVIKRFKPQVVIGVGGYASGPTLKIATLLNIPTVIQEQNSFPGKTNKLLATKVSAICTAYNGLEQFFPKDKITLTGNPVRKEMVEIEGKKEEALAYYDLENTKKTVLIIGGSLGARTLNNALLKDLHLLQEKGIQVIWQTGKFYFEHITTACQAKDMNGIKVLQFIDRMDLAYAAADCIISRAGAISVSELCLIEKPIVLVPSPNVAEDHQTKNAMALVQENAAILVKDTAAIDELIPTVIALFENDTKQLELSKAIKVMGKPNATEDIVNVIEKLIA